METFRENMKSPILNCCSKCGKIDFNVNIKCESISTDSKYVTFRCIDKEDCSNSETGIQFEKYYGRQLLKYVNSKPNNNYRQQLIWMLLNKRKNPTEYISMYDILNNIDEVKYDAEHVHNIPHIY